MHIVRRTAIVAWTAMAILLLAGCAGLGMGTRAVNPQAESALAQAQSLLDSGHYAAAAQAFLATAQAHPGVANRADLGAAASYRAQGQFAPAEGMLARIHASALHGIDLQRYQVLSADLAVHQGRAADALRWLAQLQPPVPANVQQDALDVTARAQVASGDRVGAARSLVRREALLQGAAQARAHQQAISVLAGLGKPKLQALLASLTPDDAIKPYVQTALRQSQAGTPRVLPQLNQPVGTLTEGASVPQGYAMPASVALLLPTSGPVAVAGSAVRDGFFTAYFNAASGQNPRPAVQVFNTGGTPAGAVAAYQQAIAAGAALVVGPLGRAAVAAVFAQPGLPVPVLALNHASDKTPPPAGSYEFALLPEMDGAHLAAHMADQSLHAAIVFRTSDSTATRTFNAFKAQFASLGGAVTHDVVLDPGDVDFSSEIKSALADAGPGTAIVVLLRPVQARLLLPQLKLAQSTLPVFATATIYSGTENITADGDLDGVQFSDAPWLYDAQPGLPDHATLAQQLDTAAGPAGRLFAFGMDAYTLMPWLNWLHGHPASYVPGATGQLTMDAQGQIQRTPIWVQFQGGSAHPVAAGMQAEPAPPPTGP